MRLLHTKTLQLREFVGSKIPPYAILSHCWREEEVLFSDIQDLKRARQMTGFSKIERCCSQARKFGYNWTWIDTCCIDKSSSAELSEAINSMFRWYGHASTCLVYLDDVDMEDPHRQGSSFHGSRWFTRGWTLQELLAPKHVVFFSTSWSYLGTKGSLMKTLSAITTIPEDALSHRSNFSKFSVFSVAQRMSWAADRQTTRIEDRAYSLMGLFDIFMPIIYGEGTDAFRRLQLEIIQRSRDQTIFAWSPGKPFPLSDIIQPSNEGLHLVLLDGVNPSHSNFHMLAHSPTAFQHSSQIVSMEDQPSDSRGAVSEYSYTHLGLHIRMPLVPVASTRDSTDEIFLGILSCRGTKEDLIYGVLLHRLGATESYCCYRRSWQDKIESRLICIPKDQYDGIMTLAEHRTIYITTGHRFFGVPNFHRASIPHVQGIRRVRLLIIVPKLSLEKLDDRSFSLSGHASRPGWNYAKNWEVQRDLGGDLFLEYQLQGGLPMWSPEHSGPPPTHSCPISRVCLLFCNPNTYQAFSLFIGHSRHGLLIGEYPKISTEVAFHRPEDFTSLEVQAICDRYSHHDHHGHFRAPPMVNVYNNDSDSDGGYQSTFRFDDSDTRPGLVRHCKCKCWRAKDVATTTRTFGDYKRGLSVTTTGWKEYDAADEIVYCTFWLEVSLSGRMYVDRESDELDSTSSDVADCGSDVAEFDIDG